MGGVASVHEGGGNEYICLTDHPESGKDSSSDHAAIHGVEYKGGEDIFDKDNAESLIHQDAVCAVCRGARSVQVL